MLVLQAQKTSIIFVPILYATVPAAPVYGFAGGVKVTDVPGEPVITPFVVVQSYGPIPPVTVNVTLAPASQSISPDAFILGVLNAQLAPSPPLKVVQLFGSSIAISC
jgi:hypothetical protein